MKGFRSELERLINYHSMESGSDTPDFILAQFLTDTLAAFDAALQRRTAWYAPADVGQPSEGPVSANLNNPR